MTVPVVAVLEELEAPWAVRPNCTPIAVNCALAS